MSGEQKDDFKESLNDLITFAGALMYCIPVDTKETQRINRSVINQ
jgi:hypothetical protein